MSCRSVGALDPELGLGDGPEERRLVGRLVQHPPEDAGQPGGGRDVGGDDQDR